ncbi:MAG: TolC family protein [Opitutae bacterium]|nr:TolC family protein [Opitutae bacterium]
MSRSRLTTAALAAVFAAAALGAAPNPAQPIPDELDLKTALAFALENNFAIRQARERIRQQDGVVVEVRAAEIPNVTGSGQYTRNDTALSGANFGASDRNWSYSVRATQLLFAGGSVRATVQSQTIAREAAVLAMQAAIDDALLGVRTQFYTVLVDRERIKVQEQNSELLRRQLQDVKNRFEAGTVSNFEVLRAEVALANAQPALIRARNDWRTAIEELRRVLGFVNPVENTLTKIPAFVGTLDFVPVSYDLKAAILSAREKRPDLRRLHKLEEAADQLVTARRAGYYPNLSAFGSYDWRKDPRSNNFGDTLHGWTFGLQSTWNIFDGRATAGRIVQAKSVLEQARLASSEAQLAVDVDVRRAVSALQEATELAEASKKVVEQAEESLRLANARFSAGAATQLDVFQSQLDLTTARLNQIQAFYSFNVAAAQLRKAMGLGDALISGGA